MKRLRPPKPPGPPIPPNIKIIFQKKGSNWTPLEEDHVKGWLLKETI